jgi:predicted RNA-binding Zn-ribbon protein involved in translation (DUF1610 family)
MTARDRWDSHLKCPECGKAGVASLYQEDGWSFSNGDQSTRVESVSEGFYAKVLKSGGVNFYCGKCNVEAR